MHDLERLIPFTSCSDNIQDRMDEISTMLVHDYGIEEETLSPLTEDEIVDILKKEALLEKLESLGFQKEELSDQRLEQLLHWEETHPSTPLQ